MEIVVPEHLEEHIRELLLYIMENNEWAVLLSQECSVLPSLAYCTSLAPLGNLRIVILSRDCQQAMSFGRVKQGRVVWGKRIVSYLRYLCKTQS